MARYYFDRLFPSLAVIAVLCLCQAAQAQTRILVTNDDGIDAPGITALVSALRDLGDVYVVAPSSNRSGASHSISFFSGEVSVRRHMRDDAFFGHAVNGTPADAVAVALHHIYKDVSFDLLVSGVNAGNNVGSGSLYSGTVGAALEGALNGIPSIAVSQSRHRESYEQAAIAGAEVARTVLSEGLAPGTFLNVNIPDGELKGFKVGLMGGAFYQPDTFTTMTDPASPDTEKLAIQLKEEPDLSPGKDTRAYVDGWITVAPLRADWTDYKSMLELRDWDLKLPE